MDTMNGLNKMNMIKMTKERFEEQLVRYGFFAEQVPPCFSSEKLADKLEIVMKAVSTGKGQIGFSKKNKTAPVTISTYKNGITRRVISVPNPEAYLRLTKLFADNLKKTMMYAKSSNSLSPITYIRSYLDGNAIEEINSESVREKSKAKSDFIEGIKQCICIALGRQYRLKVDVANCYNSIYTHSFTWAVCGKECAKKYLNSKEPVAIKGKYEFGDKADAFIRFQKNNETNGIVVGPYTSRIFSEIIMAAIDAELRNSGFKFKRYVDDYKFYFRSEVEATKSIQTIERILNKYNLNLNVSKTKIEKFPYESVSSMKETYKNAFEREGAFGVLIAASDFHVKGEKGAFKYALKYIRNCELDSHDCENIFPLLVNIMLLDPRYGRYVIDFLKKNIGQIDLDSLTYIANIEVAEGIKQELQQETLMFLYLIHELKLKLNAKNAIDVLKKSDDFSIIMVLDIWTNHNKMVERTRSEAKKINDEMQSLAKKLEMQGYDGEHWLLLHEVEKKQLLKKVSYVPPKRNDFFTMLDKEGITFFE